MCTAIGSKPIRWSVNRQKKLQRNSKMNACLDVDGVVADNGKNLRGIFALCHENGAVIENNSPKYSQGHGQVESMNRSLEELNQRCLSAQQNWLYELPRFLFGVRISSYKAIFGSLPRLGRGPKNAMGNPGLVSHLDAVGGGRTPVNPGIPQEQHVQVIRGRLRACLDRYNKRAVHSKIEIGSVVRVVVEGIKGHNKWIGLW
eukprot:NODE_695_length_4670_cov_0.352439.p3 type:complete len:202 gc:universal NODE_695_length_4670_cov_0.352439:2975-3580(+)